MTTPAQSPGGRDAATLRASQAGAIYVEYIVACSMFLACFSFTMQTAALYGDMLVVQAAAAGAARMATRTLPGCPDNYDGQPANELDYDASGQCNEEIRQFLQSLDLHSSLPAAVPTLASCAGDDRMRAINMAAALKLMSIVPHPNRLMMGQASWGSIGDDVQTRATFGAEVFLKGAMVVTYPDHEGETHLEFARDEDVRVRVTYLAYCSTPFVASMMCNTLEEIRGVDTTPERAALQRAVAQNDPAAIARARATLQNRREQLQRANQAMDALDHAEAPWVLDSFDPDTRFFVLEAESTLTNQGATFDCPSAS